jgi:molybdenum cofactor biosynthesis enzyme MoaA
LDPERFRKITRVGQIEKTLGGLEAALRVGFRKIKLNTVVLKNRNHDEVADLVRFAIDRGIDISFIEEMPLGMIGDHDRAEAYYSSDAIRRDLAEHFELLPTIEATGGPSKYYRIAGEETRVGFISPHSHNFCGDCNRVRVTAEGRLLLCLGQEHSADLRRALRGNPTEDERVKKGDRRGHGHQAPRPRLRSSGQADHLSSYEYDGRVKSVPAAIAALGAEERHGACVTPRSGCHERLRFRVAGLMSESSMCPIRR